MLSTYLSEVGGTQLAGPKNDFKLYDTPLTCVPKKKNGLSNTGLIKRGRLYAYLLNLFSRGQANV